MHKKPTYEELEEKAHELEQADIIRKQTDWHLNLFKKVVDSATDAIGVSTPEGRHWYQNNTFDSLFGKIGNDPPATIYCDVNVGREVFETIIAGGEWSGEVQMYATDGRVLDILLRAYAFTDENGKILGLVGIHTDITERKQAEKALRESDEKFSKAFHCAPVITGISDTNTGKYIEVNQAFYDKLGFTQKEVIGKKSSDVVRMDMLFRERVIAIMKRQGSLRNEEAIIYTKDGKPLNVLFYAEIIEVAGKSYNYATAIDITTHRKLEEQIRQTQKMDAIGTLAGGIAHDFNNMLGIIIGNISYALGTLNKDDELYEILSDVQESSKQAQSLTHQLLTFSKGGAPIKRVADINQLINKSALFSIRGSKAKCSFQLSNDIWATEIDESQMNQVIGNLVINANQAMPNGGTITIRTENTEIDDKSVLPLSAGKYIKIVVEDQGVGIQKKYISHIFEPYFTTKQNGSGLGLATAYSIIKKHDGHITVYSDIEKGTVFSIYLSASSKNIKQPDDKAEPKHRGQGKILIMDDEELLLKIAGLMLNRMGYATAFAVDGEQAISIYREAYRSQKPFDLVILDLTIPGGMGGAETIQELLKINPKIKALVSSGYSNDPIMANYEDYGFCGVVPKPYTVVQMSELLTKIFSEKG